MRGASRRTVLVGVVALAASCSAEGTQVAAPAEPPPAVVPMGPAPQGALEAPLPAVTEPEVAAPAPPPDSPPPPAPAVVDDDPLPAGAGGRAATSAPRGGAPAVRAAAAPAGRPTPTGSIEIPAIGLNHPTYEGIDLAIINYGPSHWPGKPLPGQLGNTVFPGHRTTYSKPFGDLDKLVPGNEVIFTTPAGRFTYRVTGTTIVSATDTYVVNNTPDATFTLLACHPKGSARQRIVVKGRMVNQPAVAAPAPAPALPQPGLTPPVTQRRRGLLGLF